MADGGEGKRKMIIHDRKLEIIEYAEKNSGNKQNLIAEYFDTKSTTLCGILRRGKENSRGLVSQKDAKGDT